MQVPTHPIPHLGRRPLGLLCLALLLTAAFSPAAGPPRRIPLEPLGFQPLPAQFLLAGSSLLTLHYVDDTHLLLTFSVRRLLRRLADDPPDDLDRNIDAVLLELPSGRVLARTSWRLHDHSQYLWSLGHGRFLLRIRDTITLLSPMVNLARGEPFREHPFLDAGTRRIAEIIVSADEKLLTVETVKRTPHPAGAPAPSTAPNPVQINFYRLNQTNDAEDNVQPRHAGVIRANAPGDIPVSGAGYIDVIDQGRTHWAFDFDGYGGSKKELAAFDSVCRPVPVFVSPSEFIAFGCRSGTTRQILGSFNMNGEQTWQQNLFGDYVAPSLAFGASQGRFVFSRVLVHEPVQPEQLLVPEQLGAQQVVVYQTSSGRQLFHTECTPAAPAGQNFALSPDGLSLAVIRDGAIEIDSLPKPTSKENAAVQLAFAAAPPETDLPVHFFFAQHAAALSDSAAADEPEPAEIKPTSPIESVTPPPAGSAAADTPAAAPAATTTALGDPAPPAPGVEGDPSGSQLRPKPTLYTLPSDPPRNPQHESPH